MKIHEVLIVGVIVVNKHYVYIPVAVLVYRLWKQIVFCVLLHLMFLSGCYLEPKPFQGVTQNGRNYLEGLAGQYPPIYDEIRLGFAKEIVHVLKYSTGKTNKISRASDAEIQNARIHYPLLAKEADANPDALLNSEYQAIPIAKERASRHESYWKHFTNMVTPPSTPNDFKEVSPTWQWHWDQGLFYNYYRYYRYFRKHEGTTEIETKYPSDCLSKDAFDSGWLLYNPGEFKVFTHKLNLPADKVKMVLTCKTKGNQYIMHYCNIKKGIGVYFSHLTPNKAKVHLLHKDNRIEAIRIRLTPLK